MKKSSNKNPELSIVILSYNTKDLLKDCLESVFALRKEVSFEVIVVDNASCDGSSEMVKKEFPEVELIQNTQNLGFAAANNKAKGLCVGKYVLFLNSDTTLPSGTFKSSIDYMEQHEGVGVITCKMKLPGGSLDKDSRRSFPTPWVSFTHLVLHLDKLLPQSKLFAKYWYGYISPDTTHEIDVAQGAYFLTRKRVLDEVGWFDEDYFLDGEDIDLCWRIKDAGWKIIYLPEVWITHIKGASKGKKKAQGVSVSLKDKLKFRTAGVTSMEIFYKKRLWDRYPLALNLLVIKGIWLVKGVRVVKTIVTS